MYCPKCGAANDDGQTRCANCGESLSAGPPGAPVQPEIPSYLVWAILTTLFCCLPFGIVSIIYAAQVGGKTAAGDYAGAEAASRSARTWAMVSFFCGLGVVVLWIIMAVIGALAQS